jgi:hypothetical protein
MNNQRLVDLLELSNETLSSAIVIIAVSILLYNLTRNVYDRVNRASSILLVTVTITYLADVFIVAEPGRVALEAWFRFQWIGVAFIPAAMFHLSDALLATTGLISRGRRRRAARALYVVAGAFALLALFSDTIIRDLTENPVWYMRPGPLFLVYLLYFLIAVGFAFFNVYRARRRCLTTHTRRRMNYLMVVFLTPAWGLFPYSLLFSLIFSGIGTISEVALWIVFNVANLAVLAMLAFMAYPLSFFGSHRPDRVVKAELLQFMLRGPLTGVVIVFLIQTMPRVSSILGVEGIQFTSFAVVAVVLSLQWLLTLTMPRLERWLVYTKDQQQAHRLREISERLQTRADIAQRLEAILAALCDQLRVPTAFVASVTESHARLEQVVGRIPQEEQQDTEIVLANGFTKTNGNVGNDDKLTNELKPSGNYFLWRSFWLIPIRPESSYNEVLANGDSASAAPIGVIGVWARSPEPDLDEDEANIVNALLARAEDVLVDMHLQTKILANLVELIPEEEQRRSIADVSPFGQVSMRKPSEEEKSTRRQSIVRSEEFTALVKDALRDYWGGPKLSESKLLDLNLVDQAADSDGNRIQALRRVLVDAIESLKPDGQQNLTRTEWILYNILEMRFLQGRKVRDVALRLAMSHADFYRKQRLAIEEVARIIAQNEEQLVEAEEAPASSEEDNDTILLPSDA